MRNQASIAWPQWVWWTRFRVQFTRQTARVLPLADHGTETTQQVRKRLFVLLAVALLALAIGLTITISSALFGSLKRAEAKSLVRIVELRAVAIAEWCRRAKDVAKQITSRTRIRQELEKYNEGTITLQQLDRFSKPKLRDAMNLSSEVTGILRLDASKQIVTRCGNGSRLSLNQQELAKYITDRPTISEPLSINQRPSLIVSAPIVSRDGIRQGTDLVIIGIDALKKIVTDPDELGRSSEIIIGYASEGAAVPLFPWVGEKDPSTSKANALDAADVYLAKAVSGKAGLVHTADMAIAYQPVKECDWGLIVTQKEDELYASLYRKMGIIGGLTFLTYCIVLVGFWFIMKPMAGKILLHADELENKIQEKTAILEKEIADRQKAEQEKEATIAELQDAMLEIKTLSGLLPICANCKNIRDDKGYWSQIESYISEHSDAEFSHSVCPECVKQLYPDLEI
jgi:sensor domain CHASE-containing protein